MGDWIEEKFWCNLLLFLARLLFFNWLCRNWTNLEFNEFDLIGCLYYNELDSTWFELDCIFDVPWDDICCNLVLYKKNLIELNRGGSKILTISCNGSFHISQLIQPTLMGLIATANITSYCSDKIRNNIIIVWLLGDMEKENKDKTSGWCFTKKPTIQTQRKMGEGQTETWLCPNWWRSLGHHCVPLHHSTIKVMYGQGMDVPLSEPCGWKYWWMERRQRR